MSASDFVFIIKTYTFIPLLSTACLGGFASHLCTEN